MGKDSFHVIPGAPALLANQQPKLIPVRSSFRSNNYEQTGDRESAALIVRLRARRIYGKVNPVWGGDLPSLGDDAEFYGLTDGLVPGVHIELGQNSRYVMSHCPR